MQIVNLRKVGGSVMLAVPPAFLDMLDLQAGVAVGVTVDDGRLVVAPQRKRRYSMAQLLVQSDYSQAPSPEDREWVDAAPVGGELI